MWKQSQFMFLVVLSVLLFGLSGHARGDLFVTFEEGLGHNGEIINTQYEGITFQSAGSGIPWAYGDITTDLYNVSSWPDGTVYNSGDYWMNDLVFTWTTESGSDGKIAFNEQDATYAEINYCSNSDFYLEAYNADDQLIDSAVGPPNLRYTHSNEDGPGTVRVDAPAGETIAYLLLHDSGNYWCVDNLLCNPGGVSAPGDLQIVKYLDENANGVRDPGEPFLQGWEYHVEGPNGYDEWFTTGPSGVVDVLDLEPGDYTVTETVQAGWTCTTDNPLIVTVEEDLTAAAWFGNIPASISLVCDVTEISAWYGGTANFYLFGDTVLAGRGYMLCGTLSGLGGTTLPGGETLPINWDWFSSLLLNMALNGGYGMLIDFIGTLNASGDASAAIILPGHCQLYQDLIMHFAWCTYQPYDFVSNAVQVDLLGGP